MPTYQINVNGALQSVEASEDTPLLWVLRDHLDLVGTKYGCGIAQCGSCTVHLDGTAVRSCSLTINQLEGKSITTIEGLSEDGSHPVQQAWKEVDVPQCGYCQAGQIMTASAFLDKNPSPSGEEIKDAMHGNICRCASYNRIYRAVEMAAEKMG
jgi:isoquinoline 1-oxidoreductase alpha subunit